MATEEQRSLGFLITKSARVITRLYNKELQPLGTSVPPATVLGTLYLQGPLTQSTIGEINYMDKATLSSVIRQLRDKKLIETSDVEGDARFAMHSLTPTGKQLAEQVVEVDRKLQARLASLKASSTVEQTKLYLSAVLDTDLEGLD